MEKKTKTKTESKKKPAKPEKEAKKPEATVKYFEAVGRRKTSTCRVRLWEGKGEITINGQRAADYLQHMGKRTIYIFEKPFSALSRRNKFDGSIKVKGGGKQSQLAAMVHGMARALDKYNPDFHRVLKKHNLLSRDPREKERRKYGLMGARKKKASPKR